MDLGSECYLRVTSIQSADEKNVSGVLRGKGSVDCEKCACHLSSYQNHTPESGAFPRAVPVILNTIYLINY